MAAVLWVVIVAVVVVVGGAVVGLKMAGGGASIRWVDMSCNWPAEAASSGRSWA